MVESYHQNFEKLLKRNFINIFVLSILELGPSHGYKIGLEIEKRTLGMWNPTASTLYWILNKQKEKGFIRIIEEEKNKKIYKITDMGRQALKLMKQSQRKIRKYYRRFLSSAIQNGGSVDIEELEYYEDIPNIQMLPTAMKPDKFKGEISLQERLKLLENMKVSIQENIRRMTGYIKDFDDTILKIKEEIKKER